jgi:DeoR/GlpR family transcriptional regulator of sugar metabolism
MDQPPDLESLPKEERIKLALQAIKKPQELSVRRAAVVYKVSETTLRRRRARKQSTRDTHPKSSALTKAEQQALVQYTKKLDAQGLAPTLC